MHWTFLQECGLKKKQSACFSGSSAQFVHTGQLQIHDLMDIPLGSRALYVLLLSAVYFKTGILQLKKKTSHLHLTTSHQRRLT